jgi:hypothetical protein
LRAHCRCRPRQRVGKIRGVSDAKHPALGDAISPQAEPDGIANRACRLDRGRAEVARDFVVGEKAVEIVADAAPLAAVVLPEADADVEADSVFVRMHRENPSVAPPGESIRVYLDAIRSIGCCRRFSEGQVAAQSDCVGDAGSGPTRVDDAVIFVEQGGLGRDVADRSLEWQAPCGKCTLAHQMIEDAARYAGAGAFEYARARTSVRRNETGGGHGREAGREASQHGGVETKGRKLGERLRRDPIAAGLVAGKRCAVDQRYRVSARGEVPAGGGTRGAGTDDPNPRLAG